MAIPDFQTLMLPLLRLAADGAEHTLAGSVETLAAEFSLTPAEVAQSNASPLSRQGLQGRG